VAAGSLDTATVDVGAVFGTQRIRSADAHAFKGLLEMPAERSWRLFQLAFVLLNLPSLTDLHHPDRSHETDAVADLLWFATGGGKTEAYLLAAAW
jgi:hypothetical protein